MYYDYLLRCKDGQHYAGFTADLRKRYKLHANRLVPAIASRLPAELLFYCAFKEKYKAFDFEKYLKGGSGRAFMKKRLI
jgi:predicted GIY-YIG superfamily endonuclease